MSMSMAMLGYILDVTGPLELGPAALTNHSPPEVSTVSSMKRQTVGTLDLGSNMSQTWDVKLSNDTPYNDLE